MTNFKNNCIIFTVQKLGDNIVLNKSDLLYNTIKNCISVQTINSICLEAIAEADIRNAQKLPLDIYSKITFASDSSSDRIEEICDCLKNFSKLNINSLIKSFAKKLDIEEQDSFKEEAEKLMEKFCDENGYFIFTIDAYYAIMDIYWTYERKSISRRFDNEHK